MRLVVGCEVAIDDDALPFVWLHVASLAGYGNLCRILTRSHARHPKGQPRTADEGVARNQFAGLPLDEVCDGALGLCARRRPSRSGASRA